ncbi:6-hydroxymethylpterin diphosphokinase MptE-like protein [Aeromonas sp. MdU4]|uniref:motility associated factor glycosyltransferase family protein n=1 Tax=Aeromonas sp. MdU4 TaxID=3342819 RepID=UPI0035B6CC76
MDIYKKITNVESELSRLEQQKIQEAAMLEVLPVRYDLNMKAFAERMPDIHDYFKEYKPVRPFRFFCNENGIPNILWLDDVVSLYGEDPYSEAQAQIDSVIDESVLQCVDFESQWYIDGQIHIKYNNEISNLKKRSDTEGLLLKNMLDMDIPLSLMYGIGLGYQLGYLYERCKIRNLFAFEPDLDMFYASLFCFDWGSLFEYMDQESLSLHLFIGVDEQLLAADMMEALHRKGAFWSASYFSFYHYHSPKIERLIERVEQEFYLLRTGWGFFDDNVYALAHSHTHLQEGTVFLKRQRDTAISADVPVFVVGNGPSLDQAIDFIKSHQHQAIIIACGTAVSALYKAGIKPDIYVAVERTKSSADFLRILNANDFLKDCVFLSVDVIHPECKVFFRKTGLTFKPNEPMYKLLANHLGTRFEFDTIDYSNPFVGNTGLNYAALLGFKDVYLFGIDNGYKSADKHHSSLSLYYNDKQEAKYHQDLNDTFPAPGNFGGNVLINHLFGLSIHNMSRVLHDNTGLYCVNSSDGAYIDGAIPRHVESLDPNWCAIDKVRVVDGLMDKCFQPFDLTSIDFQSALNVRLFNQLVDKFRTDWREISRDRNSVQAMMQRHHDYLLYLLMGSEGHLYRVLIGSINYFYANIITLMMALMAKDEDYFVAQLECAIGILDQFFADAEIIYADVFERHDSTYFVGLDVFKQ